MRGEDYDLSLRMLNFGFSLRGFDHAKAFKTHEYGFSSFSYALREFYQGYSQSKYIASCSNINKGNFFSSYRAAYFHFVHPHFKSLKSDDLFAYFISLSKFLGMVTGSIRGRLTREKIVLLVKKYPVLLTLKIKGFDQQDYVLHPKARLLVTNNRAKLLSPITDMFLDTNDKNMIYLFNRLLDQEYVNLYDFNEFTTDEMELIKENMNKMIKNNSLILKSQLWKFLN